MNSKKKKTIAIIAALVIVIGIFAIVKVTSSDLKLKEETIEVEYGKTVSTNPKDYLDLSKVEDKDAYLKDVKVTKDTDLMKGKKYEALGDYVVVIKDKEDEATVKVTVNDTTKPKFNKIEKIETYVGEKIDYKKFVKAKDLQKVALSFDDKEVELSKKGTYMLKVTATDESENKAEKEIKVVVKDKPKLNSGDKITTVVDKNGNVITKVDKYIPPKKTYSTNTSSSLSNNSKKKHSKKTDKKTYTVIEDETTWREETNIGGYAEGGGWHRLPEDW